MTRASIVGTVGGALVLTPLLFAQAPAPANAPQSPPKSTAIIVGQVVDGSSGQPIGDALVTLRQVGGARARGAAPGAPAPARGRGTPVPGVARGQMLEQRLITGGDGRYVFHSLPPGQFQLTAELSGYSASLTSGSTPNALSMTSPLGDLGAFDPSASSSARPSAPFAVAEGERVRDMRLRLWKHAVITGVVLDDAGEPAIGLTVRAMRRVMQAGRTRYANAATGKTDDRGIYRLPTLLPGEYIVTIPQTQTAFPAALMEGMMKNLFSESDSAAAGMGMLALSTSGIEIGNALSGGVRLGNYMVASSGGAVPLVGQDGRIYTYQASFYPGAFTSAEATPVTLKSGEERSGIDFQLRLVPTVRISGTVTGPEGPIPGLGVRLVLPGDQGEREFDVAASVTGADGAFTFFGATPGQFIIRAQREPRPDMPPGADTAAMSAIFGKGGGSNKGLFAAQRVTVGENDLTGVAVTMSEGFTVSGRFEYERTAASTPQGQFPGMSVTLTAADSRTSSPQSFFSSQSTKAGDGGTFQTRGYPPGRYFVNLGNPGGPWQIKSATVGGRDVYDAPLEITSGDITNLLITVTDQRTGLRGNVAPLAGQKASDIMVVAFPADYRTWIADGMNPRRSRTLQLSNPGAYAFLGLPTGDYLVAALEQSEEADVQDPRAIEAIARVATRVSVAGESKAQDLTVVRIKR